MIIFPETWSKLDQINYLQRKILLNSIMYYSENKNYISDYYYDSCCRQLVNLQNEYGDSFVDETEYGYVYYDFDGSTGFHLAGRLTRDDRNKLLDMNTMKLNREVQKKWAL